LVVYELGPARDGRLKAVNLRCFKVIPVASSWRNAAIAASRVVS
jgi:hypothetical protein